MHPTILSGDVTSTAINPPVNSSNDGKATDQSNNNDMNDDDEEYQSDGSVNDSHERHQDEGPSPTSCEKGNDFECVVWQIFEKDFFKNIFKQLCFTCISRY